MFKVLLLPLWILWHANIIFFILRISLSLDELSESLIGNFVSQVDPRIFAEFNYFLGRQVNLDFLKSLVKHSYISTDNTDIVKVRTIENKISSRISSMRVVNDTSGIIIENSKVMVQIGASITDEFIV
jgi:hypothetical protein